MANQNLTQKTAITTIGSTDLLYVLHDPLGTPLDAKMTFSDFQRATLANNSSALTVQIATTAILPHAPVYNNGAAGIGATLTGSTNGTIGTIDGVSSHNIGDRILVKTQASTLQNGIFEFTDLGSVSTPYSLTRTTDSDETEELNDQVVIPSSGGQINQIFGQTTVDPIIGTDPIVYVTVTNNYVSESAAGTQVVNQIPLWTATARQLTRGDAGLKGGTTFAAGQLVVGKTNQGGNIKFNRGSNGANTVTLGFSAATNATIFGLTNTGVGGELRFNPSDAAGFVSFYPGGTEKLRLESSAASLKPFNTGAGNTYEMRFLELAANGTNYVGFKSPDAITTNTIFTLPTADGTSGQALVTDGSKNLSFANQSVISNGTTITGNGTAGSPLGVILNASNKGVLIDIAGTIGSVASFQFDNSTSKLTAGLANNALLTVDPSAGVKKITLESVGSVAIGDSAAAGNSTTVIISDVNKNTSITNAIATPTMTVDTSGSSVTIANGVRGLYYDPASVVTAATITLPAAPVSGQEVLISFGGTIIGGASVVTALTIAPNGGQTIVNTTPVTATTDTVIVMKYRLATTQWYKIN